MSVFFPSSVSHSSKVIELKEEIVGNLQSIAGQSDAQVTSRGFDWHLN